MGAAIRVSMFGGIIPRLATRGLPDNAAQDALNAKLFSGELRSWNRMLVLDTLATAPGTTRTVYHYRHLGLERYLAFNVDTDVVKAPLLNETLGRLYYTNANGAFITTGTRIDAMQPPFKLGVPAPEGDIDPPEDPFTVTATGGTAATATTRVYLTTVVTNYGEESGPSETVTESGNADGTWTITGLDTLELHEAAYPNISHLRLYRTITTLFGVDYRLVKEWTLATIPASYVDDVLASDLGDNPPLESLGWAPPPQPSVGVDGLLGLVGVAGGYLAGFVGRTVRLSVPYQPHAWPEDYSYAVEDDIVGLGTFGNTIAVLTEGRPYLLVGPSPDAMYLMKMESIQPCLSKRSIVNTVAGVMYASTDGLVLIDGSANTGTIVSRQWVTKDEWLARFSPETIQASIYQDRYLAFYGEASGQSLGFTVGFDDPVTGWTELRSKNVLSVDPDELTGQTLISISNGAMADLVNEWDGDITQQLVYVWRSKPFLQTKPLNFGAIQLRGAFTGNAGAIPRPPAQGIGGYALNMLAIGGGKRNILVEPLPDPNKPYYAGSINGPPYWLATGVAPSTGEPVGDATALSVKVYGDGILRWIGKIADEETHRLPSGYKASKWEVEVEGVPPLYSLTLADTAKGLENLP
jgi:hypothetical protein